MKPANQQQPPASPGAATVVLPAEGGPGTVIGRYKLLEKIGEGGFGVVYVAEQREPVKRRVALKIIKLGMDTKQVVARFEAERQALALMDHPNIAKVLDAGATDTGRPYFVMELVKGIPLTAYCDQEKVATQQRLDLFVQVCHAIQHAHQKGIIHRDIKPSNILVTLHDGVPVPKVIDFGIAKATQQELTDKTVYTQFQQFIGTPAYMSPEQAEMSGLDIDTRTDIYSLGVLLYELLTGKTPFDPKELSQSGLDEMRKILREREPMRPSTRLRQTASLRVSPEQLSVLNWALSTDLDWIVMKCLEKDRTRRYETANALAMDVERHLRHEPVLARPPSVGYRLQKSFRRHRLAFTAAAAVCLALVLGVLVSAWQAVRATSAGRREALAHLQADQAAHLAQRERQRAEAGEQKAKASELAARRQAYAADMNLAQQALGLNDLGRARRLLAAYRPQPGEPDLRGWEWRYLWQQCRGEATFCLCQQSNPVYSLTVSHDGNWLAIGEQNTGTISVWDLRTRKQTATMASGDDTLAVTAFSPIEPLLAFSSATNVTTTNRLYGVRFWDPHNGRVVGEDLALSAQCLGLLFSADGRTLLTFTTDGQLTRWQLPSRKCLSSCPAHAYLRYGTPFPLAMTRDARFAAFETSDHAISVVELLNGKEQWTANPPEETVMALAFSPDGSILASGAGVADSSIRFWEVASGKPMGQPLQDHRAWVSSLVFSPDGRTLASASADQTIRLWDLSDPTHPRSLGQPLRGHKLEVWRLTLLPDLHTLVSGSKDGSVYVWDTAAIRHERTRLTLPPRLVAWSFGPSADSLITATAAGQNIRITRWHGTDFQQTQPLLNLGTNTVGGCRSPDGHLLASGFINGLIQVWDLEKRAVLKELRGPPVPMLPLGFSAQAHTLLVLHPRDGTVHFWDLAQGTELLSCGIADLHLRWPSATAFSPDERFCLGVTWAGESWLVEMGSGRRPAPNLNLPQVADVSFSPDGKLLAAASQLGLIRLWETTSWREVTTLRGVLMGCHSVAFSPDGTRLAVGSNGQEAVKLWDTTSFQEVLTLEGHGSTFGPTAFSPDGNVLGSMSGARLLHLWRAPSLAELQAADANAQPEPLGARPQDPAALNQWLVLAPIPFEGRNGASALDREHIPHEANLRPRAGERVGINGSQAEWKPVQVQDHCLDFNVLLGTRAEWSVAYAVCYLYSDTPQAGLVMKLGSDDQAKVYLNGKEIYRNAEPRACLPDDDAVPGLVLKPGLNVLVFKLVNESYDWQGSIRLTDSGGLPLKGLRVTANSSME